MHHYGKSWWNCLQCESSALVITLNYYLIGVRKFQVRRWANMKFLAGKQMLLENFIFFTNYKHSLADTKSQIDTKSSNGRSPHPIIYKTTTTVRWCSISVWYKYKRLFTITNVYIYIVLRCFVWWGARSVLDRFLVYNHNQSNLK